MAVERLSLDDPHWVTHHADHVSRYLYAAQFVKGKRVLDAGMGQGYGSVILMSHGAAAVDAIDIDPNVVTAASTRFKHHGVRFIVDDCEVMRCLDGEYDVICNFENIEHLRRPERFVERASELLVRDGALLCSSPDRDITPAFVQGRPENPYHEHEWFREDFELLLREYFGEVDCMAQVITFGAAERRRCAERYSSALSATNQSLLGLWRRALSKMFRTLHVDSSGNLQLETERALSAVAIPTVHDYPVVSSALASFIGNAFCHFAMCSQPRPVIQRSGQATNVCAQIK